MKFSTAFLLQLAFQRTPEEAIEYYTNKLVYKPTKNIQHNINMYKAQSTEELKENTIKPVITQVINILNEEGVLKYTEWVIYKTQDKYLPEDTDNIAAYLKMYDVLVKNPQNNLKPITSYGSFTDLQTVLEPFKDTDLEKQQLLVKQPHVDKHTGKGLSVVMEEGPYRIFKITNAEASADMCRNTGWCVKDPKYFNQYHMSESNPLYLISKEGYKYALVNFETGQAKNANDAPISSTEGMAKELVPLIKKLIDVEKVHNVDVEGLSRELGLKPAYSSEPIYLGQKDNKGEHGYSAIFHEDELFGKRVELISTYYDPEGNSSYSVGQIMGKDDPEVIQLFDKHLEEKQRMQKIMRVLGKESKDAYELLRGVSRLVYQYLTNPSEMSNDSKNFIKTYIIDKITPVLSKFVDESNNIDSLIKEVLEYSSYDHTTSKLNAIADQIKNKFQNSIKKEENGWD